ncbi:hypothetical protein NP233_g9162 [Leucocoprinus birnbaumii]|uniref:Transmembrane protein n=1 Tax=Leucocoprinus birnbaumii TaxID=56174 RepID=A0AAD5VLI6_9AGAR|nr:hypothetical protein NP233_g9162 [Leucocoprinus birnbaumii]
MPNLLTTIDDSSPIFQWSPSSSWYAANSTIDPEVSAYYQSTSTFTNSSNSYVTFTFAGHSIQVYGRKTEKHGLFQVQVDDTVNTSVDGSTLPLGVQQLLFSANGLSESSHVVTMTNLEDNKILAIDYVTWESCIGDPNSPDQLMIKTVRDTNPDIDYQGSWQTSPSNLGSFFGGTGHISTQPGSSLEYSFTGGAIALFGPTDPSGATYSVQLDDGLPQNLSFHSPQYIPQSVLYYAGNLRPGLRTLKVTYTGNGSQSSESKGLALNYINIFTTLTIEASVPRRLSASAIAAITVGTAAFIFLCVISLMYCVRRDKRSKGKGHARALSSEWSSRFSFSGRNILDGMNRMTKRKTVAIEKFDLDGGEYAAVGASDREGEYLLPNYGPPGSSEARNEGGGPARTSSHLSSVSESSKPISHLTGDTHTKQKSSLSSISIMNHPFVRSRSSTEIELGSMNSNGSFRGTPRQNEFSPSLAESSGPQGTLTPPITAISQTFLNPFNQPSSLSPPPGIINRSPPPSRPAIPPLSIRPRSQTLFHLQTISEPGPSSPDIPQYQLLERKRTVAPPLPPGAALPSAPSAIPSIPSAPSTPETSEFGARTRQRMSSIGAGGRAVVGPRVRTPSTSKRTSLRVSNWEGDGAPPAYQSNSGHLS